MTMTSTDAVQRECTPEEAAKWVSDRNEGYVRGLWDARQSRLPAVPIGDAPAEVPGECGAQYVARHVGIAWQLAYVEGWRWGESHRY